MNTGQSKKVRQINGYLKTPTSNVTGKHLDGEM